MRIAYLIDVHGRFEAVPQALAKIGEVELLIIGGDLTTGGGPDDAERAIESWRPLAPRLLAVAGNMDSAAIDARLAELGVALDGRGVAFDEVGVFGVSAAPTSPLHTPYELADDELERRIETGFAAVAGCRLKIFCPHAPPLETACDRLPSGEHAGSAAIRAFVEREQPDVVLCGHIHEARGEDAIGRSKVVNPGPARGGHYALLEVGDEIAVSLDGAD
jgi:Icc-related predicted phosphoesterase